jgi:hypothetical protein
LEVTATGLTTVALEEDNRKETKDEGEKPQCEQIHDTHNTRDARDNENDNDYDGDQQKDHDGENKTPRMSAARRFLLRLGVVPHHCWVCSSIVPGFRTTLRELDIIEEQKREKMKVKASGDDWSKGEEEEEDVEEEGKECWGASSWLNEDCKRTSSITNRLKATLRRIRGKKEREAKKQREGKNPVEKDPEEDIPFETIRQLHDEEMEAARKRGARALKCFKRRAAQCIAEDIVSKNKSAVYAPLYFNDLSDSHAQAGTKQSVSRRERGQDRSDNARDGRKSTERHGSRRSSQASKESTESRRNSLVRIGGNMRKNTNIDKGERQVAGSSGVVNAKNTKKRGTRYGHDEVQQQKYSIQQDKKKNISDQGEDDIVQLNWNQNANVGAKVPSSAGDERQERASRVREHKRVCTDCLKNSCSCLLTTFLCFFLCVCPK